MRLGCGAPHAICDVAVDSRLRRERSTLGYVTTRRGYGSYVYGIRYRTGTNRSRWRWRVDITLAHGGPMDFLVLLEDVTDRAPPTGWPHARELSAEPPLAHVNSVPSSSPFDAAPREVVTLYGAVDAQALALALAAAFEGRRIGGESAGAIRHLGVWPERGAVGDAAWRDRTTGQLMTQDVEIPFIQLTETARQLLAECGSLIGQMVAGLQMPDWPEGMRRAINFSLGLPSLAPALPAGADALLDSLREADGYDVEGD